MGNWLAGAWYVNYVQYTWPDVEDYLSPAEAKTAQDDGIEAFFRERLEIAVEEGQRAVLLCESKRVIVNCSRQWGKSTIAAGKALHRAVKQPGCLVLVASPTERQSGEFLRKAKTLAARAGERAAGDGHNRISLRLKNGSRIVGLPGTEGTVRGFSAVSLLIIDEASRVSDAMYQALRPMLAVSNGDLWMLSTPMGKQGFFYETWEFGEQWARFRSPVTECPRVTAEFIAEEREVQGEHWFRQEYLCEFLDHGEAVFGRDLVEAALDDGDWWELERAPTGPFAMPLARGKVVIGVDLGKQVDFTAIAVMERREGSSEMAVRYVEQMPLGTPFPSVVDRVRALSWDARLGSRKHLVVDATGLGGPVVDMLRRAGLGCGLTAVTITGGAVQRSQGEWWYVPKQELLTMLQVAMEMGDLRVMRGMPGRARLVREMISMRRKGDGVGGEHDDLAMAVALGCWGMKRGEIGFMGQRLPGI